MQQTPEAPRLKPLHLRDLSPAGSDALSDYDVIEGQQLHDVEVDTHQLSGLTFTECELKGFRGPEVSLNQTRFSEVRMEAWDLPVAEAHRLAMRRVEVEGSRLGAMQFYNSTLNEVLFSSSKLGWINLRGSHLRDVEFRHCTIEELDLSDATCHRMRFTDCRIGILSLHNATLTHVDLRGLTPERINGIEWLRGATVSTFQLTEWAPLLAHHLGIRVTG